jgi:V/A-type H+-transporting ATPase subunit B
MMPILTMPGDDKTHPVPDVTGYITDGQIILSRDLHKKGVTMPVDVLKSQSRVKDSSIGQDHADLKNQLLRAYANSPAEFAEEFERRYLTQGRDEYRTIEDTLAIGRELLSILDA